MDDLVPAISFRLGASLLLLRLVAGLVRVASSYRRLHVSELHVHLER
jgi:hypothetical protein